MINVLRKRAIDKVLRLSYARQLFFTPDSQCAYFIAVFHALSGVPYKLKKKKNA